MNKKELMKQFILFFICLLSSYVMFSQENLVQNAGFENSRYSVGDTRELKKVGFLANYWYVPLPKRSPHIYILPDKNVAKAHAGSASIGMELGGVKQEKSKFEYITGELKTPLVKGQTYCVSFHILLHRSSRYASNNIGLLFHRNHKLISDVSDLEMLDATLYANKGDFVTNTKWQKYNSYYVASGGETFISLGKFGKGKSIAAEELGLDPYFQLDGFKSNAYYQLDDISVIAQSENVDCGCAEPPVKDSEILTESSGLKPFLFALDASGSMSKGSLFDSLRNNLIELLSKLPNGTPVTFTTFSSNARVLFSDKINENTSQIVDSLLTKVSLGGSTNIYDGLLKASKSWSAETKDSATIVLISDGNFSVSSKIENLVKNEFENNGRRLTVVHIDSEAKGAEKLLPYQTSYIHVDPSELQHAIFQVYRHKGIGAMACECVEEYADTMNYHFVIDYSGSMKLSKNRAIRAVSNLYEEAPETALISITAFSEKATELYVGRKFEMSLEELEELLKSHDASGGTAPYPGVKYGLRLAQRMSDNRFSHLIIITDLNADKLNEDGLMKSDIQDLSEQFDLAVSSVAVDIGTQLDVMENGRAQFDVTSGVFRDVPKPKFEKDLFETGYSSCDYTTQPYHYNPSKDIAKEVTKQTLRIIIRELMRGATF